jgi:nitric oxide reductase subunit C
MNISHAKAIFVSGTILSSLLFFVLTYDSILKMPQRTHEDNLSAEVAAGKWTWQKYNCNDCHTILGIGGYYAPDMTKVMSRRDSGWISKFLKDPHAVWPAERRMPDLHLSDAEIADLTAFLTWVNGIDTNNWPPKPVVMATSGPINPGELVFKAQGCSACHTLNGIGGKIGPDLTHVGSKRSREWIEEQIKNPKSHYPDSIMPVFAKLPERDREALTYFLSELK